MSLPVPTSTVVVDHDRRDRREVLLVEVGVLLVPALLAGLRVERDEVVVGRDEVAALSFHRPTPRLPIGVPPACSRSSARARGRRARRSPRRCRATSRRATPLTISGVPLTLAGTAGRPSGPWPPTMTGGPPPPKRPPPPPPPGPAVSLAVHASDSCFTVRLVDLRQRAVALARVVARVGRPGLAERLTRRAGSSEGAGAVGGRGSLASQRDRQGEQRRQRQQQSVRSHFSVTR